MEPRAKNIYRATGAIESRVGDELIVERAMHFLPDLKVVVGLQNFLQTVGKISVTREDAGASGLKKFLMNMRDRINDSGHAEGIVRPIPPLALDAEPERRSTIDVGKGPRFVLAVAPS